PEERGRMMYTAAGHAARTRKASGGNPIPFPIRWGGWEFDLMLNGKRFKLRPEKGDHKWMYVCDTGSFYQSSLLVAINPKSWPEPICNLDEYRTVKAGKEDRGRVTIEYGTPVDPDTILYNALENELLSRLMDRTNTGFVAMGLKLTRLQWFGPGQPAQQWLKQVAVDHSGEKCREAGPDWAFEAAQGSYFGGWFEIMAHGHIPGPTYEYDINSAYPHVIAGLPCLLHGTWSRGDGAPPRRKSAYRLVRATIKGSDPFIGPMAHRTPKGRVLRPWHTGGWYWQHELEASKRTGLIDTIKWHEWVEYQPCPCEPPFAAIADLYDHRIAVGKDTPQGKASKLVYNSSYGKFAQSIGNPYFGNAVYASLITAGTRTAILDAIATHPQGSAACIMVATDGVYFTSPHPNLPLDDTRLGAWGEKVKQNMTLFKPGVYWDDAARDAAEVKLKSRGINARQLAKILPDVDALWDWFAPTADHEQWPSFRLDVPFGVVTPKQALGRGKWDTCGRILTDGKTFQSSAPHSKRAPCGPSVLPDDLLRSRPHDNAEWNNSTPYSKKFGRTIFGDETMFAGDHPSLPDTDDATMLFLEILKAES
ncbi:MAG: DNA polymerase, partial [bacterium]